MTPDIHKKVKELLLDDAKINKDQVAAMMTNPLSVAGVYESLLVLRFTVNQTVQQITKPHNETIAIHKKQLNYLKSNPLWKRIWLAFKNDYSCPEPEDIEDVKPKK